MTGARADQQLLVWQMKTLSSRQATNGSFLCLWLNKVSTGQFVFICFYYKIIKFIQIHFLCTDNRWHLTQCDNWAKEIIRNLLCSTVWSPCFWWRNLYLAIDNCQWENIYSHNSLNVKIKLTGGWSCLCPLKQPERINVHPFDTLVTELFTKSTGVKSNN